MKKIDLFALTLVVMIFISNFMLLYTGEARADVYLSLSILIYYILYSVIPPVEAGKHKEISLLNGGLFIIFLVIVSYRVYQVLYPG